MKLTAALLCHQHIDKTIPKKKGWKVRYISIFLKLFLLHLFKQAEISPCQLHIQLLWQPRHAQPGYFMVMFCGQLCFPIKDPPFPLDQGGLWDVQMK